ncbi:MAG: hypothetical protein ACRC2S_00490 [Waterburya sp.]
MFTLYKTEVHQELCEHLVWLKQNVGQLIASDRWSLSLVFSGVLLVLPLLQALPIVISINTSSKRLDFC